MNISNRRCDSGDWAISGCWTRNFHGSVKAPDARQDIAALGVVAVALVVCLAAWHRFFMIPNSHQSALVDVGECWYSMVSFHTFFPFIAKKPQIIAIYCRLTPQIPRDAQVCFPCYLAFVAATGCGPPRVQRALAAMLLSQQKISFTGCEP